jgi:hypothetical protein
VGALSAPAETAAASLVRFAPDIAAACGAHADTADVVALGMDVLASAAVFGGSAALSDARRFFDGSA